MQPVFQQGKKRGSVFFVAGVDQVTRQHGRMQAGNAQAIQQRVQRRHVAVADQQLGVALQERRVHAGQQTPAAVAAAQAVDGVHILVGKSRVQVSQPLFVGARQIALLLGAAWVELGAQTVAREQGLNQGRLLGFGRACGGDDAHRVPGS